MTWAQHELWTLCIDAPREINGFILHVRHLWSPGFTQETGTRIHLETAGSLDEIRRLIQEKSSENTIVQIVEQEKARVDNFAEKLGFIAKVNSAIK